MGDPVTAGAVGSVVAPSFGAAAVNPISAGFLSGMTMPATITGIGKDISAIGAFTKEYPIASQMGFGLAQNLLSPEQQRMQSIGASTRQGAQMQPVDYMSLLNPQQQTVLRPATPSLI